MAPYFYHLSAVRVGLCGVHVFSWFDTQLADIHKRGFARPFYFYDLSGGLHLSFDAPGSCGTIFLKNGGWVCRWAFYGGKENINLLK